MLWNFAMGGDEILRLYEGGSEGRSALLSAGGPGDSDYDGLPDEWERLFFGGLGQNAEDDGDNDGLSNLDELSISDMLTELTDQELKLKARTSMKLLK